jgi:high-affinity nickel-transport protein
MGLVLLAYSLGLRHAVDPDHIAAIDNSTRKLMQDGKKPVAVGFFFALGHSTVVLLASAVVAYSASFMTQHLSEMKATGSLIGTIVSSSFLILIGVINLIVLFQIFQVWRGVLNGQPMTAETLEEHLQKGGLLARILRPLLKLVGQSWHLYLIGLLFGLGFDTASEVAILSISGSTGATGMPFSVLIVVPIAFAIGMALLDTLDGVMMLGAYGWAFLKPARKLYYNMALTFTSVLIALFIGGIEALQVISKTTGSTSGILNIANTIQLDGLGFYVVGIFAASWIASMLWYKWRGYEHLV